MIAETSVFIEQILSIQSQGLLGTIQPRVLTMWSHQLTHDKILLVFNACNINVVRYYNYGETPNNEFRYDVARHCWCRKRHL